MREFLCVLNTVATLISIKIMLIPAYVSTDFEVHRNWMAIVWNRPIGEWYSEETSQWTLDYPPFFAWFEMVVAAAADFLGIEDILKISATPVFSKSINQFMRASVLFTDLFFYFACWLYAFRSPRLLDRIPKKLKTSTRETCFILLAALQVLLIVDSIHFQYNSMLTGIFLISMYFVDCGRLNMAALTFAILLNFKHIYLYYALGYVFYYLVNYFQFSGQSIFKLLLKNMALAIILLFSLLIPFAVSLAPFYMTGGIEGLLKIAERLFPVSRGLTHAFWAPNFWALYNFVDLVAFKVLSLLKIGDYKAPTYTSGLVQEYSHSVLPSITPLISLILVVISSIVVLGGLVIGRKGKDPVDFSVFATFSALCFFFFGYHVHEKAIILVTVPMIIFAVKDPKYLPMMMHITTISAFTVFPLIFTVMEIPVKWAAALAYFCNQLLWIKNSTRMSLSQLVPTRNIIVFVLLSIVEIYQNLFHDYLFPGRFPFAPLMAISVLNAIEITKFFGELIWKTFHDGLFAILWAKGACRVKEELIKSTVYPVQTVEDTEEIDLIGGLDISASKTNPDMVVIGLSIFSKDGELVKSFVDTKILEFPYVPQYLAVREAEAVAEFVKKVLKKYPEVRPDVLLCDGFGQYHSRDCGMACHVGALTGIPTIGVAKNLPLHDVIEKLGPYTVDAFMNNVREQLKKPSKKGEKSKEGAQFVKFDLILPNRLNILRMGNNMSGVFVSAGYGIDLDLATQICLPLLKNNTTVEPIRHADLQSREYVRLHYDSEEKEKDKTD